jgi:hypothetical protein
MSVLCQLQVVHRLEEEIHHVQSDAGHLVGKSETLEDVDGQVDDGSQLDCIVGLTRDDNTSTSTGWTTVNYKSSANSRTGRFIDRVMAAANVPGQCSYEPLCGRVTDPRAEQTSDNQSISLTGHSADSSIQSGMSDADQSVQCLGYVYHSCDSIRYFRSNSLTHNDDYLSVYDTNSCEYNDAAHGLLTQCLLLELHLCLLTICKKRQGAKATEKLRPLASGRYLLVVTILPKIDQTLIIVQKSFAENLLCLTKDPTTNESDVLGTWPANHA